MPDNPLDSINSRFSGSRYTTVTTSRGAVARMPLSGNDPSQHLALLWC